MAPYHSSNPRGAPISNKILTTVIVAGGALLLSAAPPYAVAPDLVRIACTPSTAEPQSDVDRESLDVAQQALVQHLSKRFFVAPAATERMVAAAHWAAAEVGLDPLLVLAVISIESRFNPIAESVMGAKGLMQIIPKYHLDKLRAAGGEDAVFDPESNIHVGTRILQEYVYRTGTLEAGLQFYNGARRDGSAQYAHKVLAERMRLEQVLRARDG
ncbi:MAG TPA: transglycosylase SLT domain-containing protein [Burkholderiales bacterium]|nr:transglycosylase SLT domain-containing protein [Burkholderiales bacterium]